MLLCLGLFIGACSTDLEVNAPYQETAAIYAILNADSATQYIRINKGFQNRTGDAREIARNIQDSSQYRPGEILVQIIQQRAGQEPLVITCEETTSIPKDLEGDFYAPDQIIYRSAPGSPKLDPTLEARVLVRNVTTGYEAEGSTILPGNVISISPSSNPNEQPPAGNIFNNFVFSPATPNGPRVSYLATCRSFAMVAELDVVVQETFTNGQVRDTVLRVLNLQTQDFLTGACSPANRPTDQRDFLISTVPFFNLLRSALGPNNAQVANRRFKISTLRYVSVPRNFSDYLLVRNNFLPVTQTQPTYTNVSSGVGLVTARNVTTVRVNIDNGTVVAMNSLENQQPRYPDLAALKFVIN